MQRKICCFAGHGKMIYDNKIRKQISNKCRELICDYGVNEFWVGNYGAFDHLAANIVREIKQHYAVKLNLIIPYLTKEINEYKEQYQKNYDYIIMADIPEKTPYPYRIIKCNQYMIQNSSFLIAYVIGSSGGAAKTLAYANQKKDIKIYNFFNNIL